MLRLTYSFLLVVVLWVAVSSALPMEDFFPDAKHNLTEITWAHAVNNQTYLTNTLHNAEINMIEADIQLGTLINGTEDIIPIMSHSANATSDLSLQDFLKQVQDFNSVAIKEYKKGIKLDFKTTDVFRKSLEILTPFDKDAYPIWLNADILPGPINATATPVDPKTFFSGAKSFPYLTLSIGWTTQYGSEDSGSYEADQINAMISEIRDNNVEQTITFPVRAGLAAQSKDVLENLVNTIENSTLTIWSSEGDNVNVDDLRGVIMAIGVNKTYIDVPKDLLDKLHLVPPNSSPCVFKFAFTTYAIIALILGLRNIFQSI